MKKLFAIVPLLTIAQFCMAQKIRGLADAVGFAHTALQVDTLMDRISRMSGKAYNKERQERIPGKDSWKLAVCPHDDHTYVGELYPALLKDVRTRTVIIFGVAHRARLLGLENKLIFDSYTHWQAPYGNVKISPMRDAIMKELPESIYHVSDSMQAMEHSVEAIVPFLQYYNRNVEIVSILVPHMPYQRMEEIAVPLAEAIGRAARKLNWVWGRDYSIVISNDAVHYGDEDWGGKNFARFGADTSGYKQAVQYEHSIIDECLTGELKPPKVKLFTEHTVQKENFREYKWTWCGRYSVPFGLLTGYYLQHHLKESPLKGTLIGYGTSIDGRPHIPVEDIGLGVTAPAKLRHWVGYASIGYR